jgi:hypothetical protein
MHCRPNGHTGKAAVLLLLSGLLRSGEIVLRRIDGRNDMPESQLEAAHGQLRGLLLIAELADMSLLAFLPLDHHLDCFPISLVMAK